MSDTRMPDCRDCYDRQLRRLVDLCGLDETAYARMREVKDDIIARFGDERVDSLYMGEMLERIAPILGTDDPYAEVKADYNRMLLEREPDCLAQIERSDDPFQLALRYAAAGNLIDFGAKHSFDRAAVDDLLARVPSLSFAIDDSEALHERIRSASSILYLGDNCGEIVLDKVLIEQIAHESPDADIVFGVRGGPIINDVTVRDAEQVGMGDVARVLPSGLAVPGTVPAESSDEFQRAYYGADVVISKGMGNFETLGGACGRDDVFFVLMAKCELVADIIGAPLMSLVCKRSEDGVASGAR